MARRSTLLRSLLRERHWQKSETFRKEYDRAAHSIDPSLVGTGPSRSQLTRWQAGDVKSLPHPDHCRVLEAMFPGVTANQLFAPVDTALPLESEPTNALAANGQPARSTGVPATPRSVHDVPFDVTGGRRRWSAAETLHEEIVMATEESARFVRRARGTVTQDVLDQLDADVRQLAVDYLTRPPYAMFAALARMRGEVFEMLDAHQRPSVLPSLYRIGGQLCALLAHASADLGHTYPAETETRAAWLCADLAESNPLRAYVRWVQANVAYWNGEYYRAAELAQSAQRYATTGTSLLRLASQEARAYAAAGDHREVDRALGVAMAAREQPRTADEVGVFRFELGKAAYYASEIRLALGGDANYRRAAADANEALNLFQAEPEPERSPELVAAAQLDLCTAQVALDDLDAADRALRPALAVPTESRTVPVAQRMSKVDKAIAGPRFARSMLAKDMREQIALFCAYTATRELPAEPSYHFDG